MTLDKDDKKARYERARADRYKPQSRTQKIVMWSIFSVAGVLLVVAIVLAIVNRVRLF